MKNLNKYILEKFKISKDIKNINSDNIEIIELKNGLFELLTNKENEKKLSTFLKGKYGNKSIKIHIKESFLYIHISRYVDIHNIELSIVIKNEYKWPEEDEWKDAIEYSELDDRESARNMFNEFYAFLEKNIK